MRQVHESKLSKFENWLTSGEHGDEEANVAAMASVKEARKLTGKQWKRTKQLLLNNAVRVRCLKWRRSLLTSQKGRLDCKKAYDDETALEQQKQAWPVWSSPSWAERDSKRSRKQCKRSRAEQLQHPNGPRCLPSI